MPAYKIDFTHWREMMDPLILDGRDVTLEEVVEVAGGRRVEVSPEILSCLKERRGLIEERMREGEIIYGVNTGFGMLKGERVGEDDLDGLQVNLIRSHSAGFGKPLSGEEVRGMLFLRLLMLIKGYSGVRPVVIETMVKVLNSNIYPVVPEMGSAGASGDLAPLAHIALSLIGEGEVFSEGRRLPSLLALRMSGIEPLSPRLKEGVALINGTQGMTSLGVLSLLRLETLIKSADIAGAMSLEAAKGTAMAFRKEITDLRPHRGAIKTAANMRGLLEGSEIGESHKGCGRVQDPYSFRCIPQVHGAVRDTVEFSRSVFEKEVDSVSDNPILLPDTGEIIQGGNFHGLPLAQALDYLAISATNLGSISERRTFHLLNGEFEGLPSSLVDGKGLHSGLMMGQVTQASLCAQMRILSSPASVHNIPTSGGQEDHVSMGFTSALKFRDLVDLLAAVISFEVLTSAQALEFRRPLNPGKGVFHAFEKVRSEVPVIHRDTPLTPLVERVKGLILQGNLISAVEDGGVRLD